MENQELLRVNHLKKYFQTPSGTLSAVDDVTFGINRMETLGGSRRERLRQVNAGTVHSPAPRADGRRSYF